MLLINKVTHAPLSHIKLPPSMPHLYRRTFVTWKRATSTINAQILKSVHVPSIIQSQSLCNRTSSFCHSHASAKYLFTQSIALQRQRPWVNQRRHYSCTVSERNLRYGSCPRKLLTLPKHQLPVTIPQRHMSLEWLDNLALTQAGWFRALGESKFVANLMEGLQAIHDYSHLPWWSSIILSTIFMRVALTLPLAVYQVRASIVRYHESCGLCRSPVFLCVCFSRPSLGVQLVTWILLFIIVSL